jgi:type I restriction enzyme, S subunit
MSESKKLIPKRRFKEFVNSKEWLQSFLHEISEIYDGTHQTPKYTKSGIMFLSVEDIKTLHSQKFISEQAYEKDFKIKPAKNDILMTRIGDIGTANIIEYDISIAYYVSLALIRTNLNAYFLQANITSPYIQAELWKRTLHVAFPKKINKNEIENILVNYPSLKEQTQIGEFFKKLDNLINTQQKKLEKTTILKSAYLTEMFPNEGELKPRLRFNSFINAWHIKDINDLANRYDNFRIPITASNRKIGLTPYYGANGIQDYVQGFTHDGEYILIAEDGANDFKNYPVQYVKGKIWVNNHAHVLQGKIGICDNKFLMNAFKNINIEPYLVGGSRAKLNSDTMMNISLKVPNQQEQTKIGNFFKLLDDKIALEQKKLDKLKHIKQAYLNEMFV